VTLTRRRTGLLAGVLMCILATTACGSGVKAGSAATVDDSTLTESQVADISDEINGVIADSNSDQVLPANEINLRIVALWVDEQITEHLAAERGVTVTDSEVDTLLNKFDKNARVDITTGSAIPPSQLERAAQTLLLRQKLGMDLAPGGDNDAQAAALTAALVDTANSLDVSVNPRFGTWDPSTWVGPDGAPAPPRVGPRAEDRLSELSATPAASAPVAPASP